MNSLSPYQPPQAGGIPSPSARGGRKRRIKVFGILHLVFGVLGILMTALVGLFSLVVVGVLGGHGPSREATAQESRNPEETNAFMHQQLESNWLLMICFGVPALIMLVAGVLLLRKKKAGLLWSNLYSVSSILAKAVMGYQFYGLLRNDGTAWEECLAYSGSLMVTWCLYAVLALFLLNWRGVREALPVRVPRPAF